MDGANSAFKKKKRSQDVVSIHCSALYDGGAHVGLRNEQWMVEIGSGYRTFRCRLSHSWICRQRHQKESYFDSGKVGGDRFPEICKPELLLISG